MTIKELIEYLQTFPDPTDAKVLIADHSDGTFKELHGHPAPCLAVNWKGKYYIKEPSPYDFYNMVWEKVVILNLTD